MPLPWVTVGDGAASVLQAPARCSSGPGHPRRWLKSSGSVAPAPCPPLPSHSPVVSLHMGDTDPTTGALTRTGRQDSVRMWVLGVLGGVSLRWEQLRRAGKETDLF